MNITFEHVGLYSKDINKMRDWYIKVFDVELLDGNDNQCFVKIADNIVVELIHTSKENIVEMQSPHSNGIRHLAFYTDDIEHSSMSLTEFIPEISFL